MAAGAQQVLWAGFDGLDLADLPGDFAPGGVVVFAKNLDPDPLAGPRRLRQLLDDLRARSGPLVVAIDQEGGPVSRLRAWTGPTPGLRDLWLAGGESACEAWGALWGMGLRMLGIDVDFAPVVDRFDGHPGTGLEGRCASSDPGDTARAAGAFLHGLEGEQVRGCLKHFPGLGGTLVDSHRSLPELGEPQLLEQNLRPFLQLAHPDRLVMVAHLRTPRTGELPASLHAGSVKDNPWGIQARWIPDSLDMGGCGAWSWDERVRLALEAGHEALLVCMPFSEVQACGEALARLPEAAWAPAAERFGSLRARVTPPGPWDDEAFQAWLQEVRGWAQATGCGA